MFASPKKYHPMIVENAKNNIQIAIKISPNLPYNVEKAYWLSCAPVRPVVLEPVVIITSAVRLRITNVSMNTPIIATKPCSTGCFTFATACACGVELVWNMADCFNSMMVIPNAIALVALSGLVKKTHDDYYNNFLPNQKKGK